KIKNSYKYEEIYESKASKFFCNSLKMSYYKDTKKVGKMFTRLTTGGSNPVMAETVGHAPLLIELSDRVSPASDVSIPPITASYEYTSGSESEIKKLLDNQGKLMHKFDRLMPRFEEMEERIDSRLRAVDDKLFATLDVSELQSFVESTVKGAANALIKKTVYPTQQELKE
ncbi:20719_t:CDS:2, partial [Gigaspora rosea]